MAQRKSVAQGWDWREGRLGGELGDADCGVFVIDSLHYLRNTHSCHGRAPQRRGCCECECEC